MSKRIYPTAAQIRRVARQAQDIGITRVGALAVSPNGLIWIFDASLARHAADSADEDGESENPFAAVERRLAYMKAIGYRSPTPEPEADELSPEEQLEAMRAEILRRQKLSDRRRKARQARLKAKSAEPEDE